MKSSWQKKIGHSGRQLACVALCAFSVVLPAETRAETQEKEDMEAVTSAAAEERGALLSMEEIEEQAEKLALEESVKRLDLPLLAKKLQLQWPLQMPKLTFESHDIEAHELALQQARVAFPDKLMEDKEEEAEEIFKPIHKGDTVTLQSTRPPYYKYTGRIQDFNARYVRIGPSAQIATIDLAPEVLDRFDEKKTQENKMTFLKKERERIEQLRKFHAEEKYPQILERKLLMDGYVPTKKDGKNKSYLNTFNWSPAYELLENAALKELERIKEDVKEEILQELLEKNGFGYDEKKGTWRRWSHCAGLPKSGKIILKRSWLEKRTAR